VIILAQSLPIRKTMLSEYQFQYPFAFWLLALVPVFLILFLYNIWWKRRTLKRIGDPGLVKSLFSSYSSTKNIIKYSFVLLAFILGCIALANPRKPDKNSGEARSGIDIVVALDISNSMKASDVPPDRLSKARQFMTKLVDNLKDDRLGLVVFAGNAYAQMPLTFDREAARLYIAAANPNFITAQGTSIGDAFQKSDLLFGEESERFKSIILITDGETHDQNALEAAKELASKGVMINTLGIGSPEGSTITDTAGVTKKDASGQVVITKLNEDILQKIAAQTNGKYVHLENTDAALKEIMAQYSDIEKKALGDASMFNYNTFYHWMAIPMLLLLIAEIFLPDRKKLKL
jgi:Ca-activated chloride channel homolog